MADLTPQDVLKSAYDRLNSLGKDDKVDGKNNVFVIEGNETTISSYIASNTVEAIIGEENTLTVTGLKIELKEDIENLAQKIEDIKGDGWDGQTVKGNADAIASLPRFATRNAGNGIIQFPEGAKMVQVYSASGRLKTNVTIDVFADRIELSGSFTSTDEVRILY